MVEYDLDAFRTMKLSKVGFLRTTKVKCESEAVCYTAFVSLTTDMNSGSSEIDIRAETRSTGFDETKR